MAAFLSFFALLIGFIRTLHEMSKDPRYRGLFLWICCLILTGLVFYRVVEGWGWLDSLYFSVITLTTIGYGDISPTTPASKIFTMVYAIFGLTMFATFIKVVAESRNERIGQHKDPGKTQSDPEDEVSTEVEQSDND